MKTIALLLVVGATACATAKPAAAPSAQESGNPRDVGATSAQASDDPKRPLKESECEELGAWIAQVCHDHTSRQATIDGWCSDIVAKTSTGSWAGECSKTLTYMDAVCFRSVDTPQALMTCDRTVER